ncbi:predicted protein [Naegleria gruberi]|uniref:Predicted protein n=1 Tax=Naegleria gruberi TaxID=5762 RepID=D2W4U1_NAEGR|nr:uncharacterized protein NAEGRDRAFT_61046 [Naegleria gruberi]EFC35912.1 predicted protein [Naegleria gruberi]|eukprot:XP_002668656.1 predicted protein [Naegleria gruberi strain NEG-M]
MAISFFSVTSILSVFLTKYLMDMGEYSFHFPLTMAWFHLIVSLLCIICTYNLNRLKKTNHLIRTCFSFLPDFEFKFDTAVQIAPVSLCYVGMVTFNNLCLDYADIHTYHTARSISICFTVIFTSVLLGEKVQKRIIGACLMIAIGYFMTGFEELQLSKMQSIGFAFGLMSSCFMALYSIYLKKLMSSSHRNHWIILIYNVVCAILFLFPVCYFTGEFEKAISVNYLFEPKFLAILTTTALIAYVVNISNFMLISYTSPLTTSVTISMKSVVESFLSFAVHNTHVSTYGLLSSAFTVVGTYLYSYFKVKDKREFEGLVD